MLLPRFSLQLFSTSAMLLPCFHCSSSDLLPVLLNVGLEYCVLSLKSARRQLRVKYAPFGAASGDDLTSAALPKPGLLPAIHAAPDLW